MLRIKSLRTLKGFTIYRLSQLTGISQGMVKAYENGKSEPSASKLLALANALDVGISELFQVGNYVAEDSVAYSCINMYFDRPIDSKTDLNYYKDIKNAKGRINLPHIKCDFWVDSGRLTMEPYVKAGSVLGLNHINDNYLLDPDLLYYIITTSGPMIKGARYEPLKKKVIFTNHLGKDYTVSLDQIHHILHLAHFIS